MGRATFRRWKYGEKTIERAIRGTDEFYEPPRDATEKTPDSTGDMQFVRDRETDRANRINELEAELQDAISEIERLESELENEREQRRELLATLESTREQSNTRWSLLPW